MHDGRPKIGRPSRLRCQVAGDRPATIAGAGCYIQRRAAISTRLELANAERSITIRKVWVLNMGASSVVVRSVCPP
jgi:hypothetical protein